MSDRKCGNCLHNIRGTEYIPPCSQCRDYSLWAENPEPSELEQLQAELATANKQILEYEQAEAAVCPEDVGIKEYVESLLNKLATAKAENEDLCDNVDAARQDLADYLAGTLKGKLQVKLDSANHDYTELLKERADYVDENKRLRGALEEIHITAARQCDCKPNGGLYACELHRAIAEETLKESDHEVGL